MNHQSGEIIQNKYRITGILGQGGVAITYSAINLETEESVAVKVISLKQLDNWKQVELFQREAEVLAKLDHPAIPKYIDYFDRETDTDKAFYIVQQQAPGKSLFDIVQSGWRTTEAEVKNIAQQILAILSYLHSLDPPIIHRDLKPNNLIRDDEGKIYLVDFGAVQNTYYNTLMQGSTVVGTYGYMAPEQFRGQALPTTDLYSLGATLLYLLTHRSPAELPQDTLKLDFRNSVDISESFADWLDKILEPDIDDRFGNADEALAKLFASKKKKQRKLINSIAVVILAIGLIFSANSYKWFFLSYLCFYPSNICLDKNIIQNYINQGGKANFTIRAYEDNEPILNCVIESYRFKSDEKYKIVKLLLTQGSDVNKKDKYNRTPLFISAKRDQNIDIVKLLLNNGADPNIRNDRNETPLLVAGDSNIKKLLVERGANVNAQDQKGNNPLLKAVSQKDIEIARLLINNGADVNAKTERRGTILRNAVSGGNTEIVKLLIENDVDVSNDIGALFAATFRENIEIVKLLLENGANAKAIDNQGNTVLFSAASQTNLELVKILIEHGADPRLKNKYEQSSLANVKIKEIAELLIKNGADVNAQKKIKRINSFSSTFPSNVSFRGEIIYGNTPLFNAISRENIDIVKLLLKNGAKVNTKNENYNTSLFNAVSKNNIEIVKLLIQYGAKVNGNNGDGKSILFYANDQEIAQILIDNIADINAKNARDFSTPLFVLRNLEVIKLLIKHDADINARNKLGNTPIFHSGDIDKIQLLIDNGAEINAKNKIGSTPLFYSKNIAVMKLLIDNGANINAENNSGETPLFNYRGKGYVKFLIDNGANVNVKNSRGETPLFNHIAKNYNSKDVIELLINNGADVNTKNALGQTPLSWAIFNEQKEIAQLLIDKGADTAYLNPDKGYFDPDVIKKLHMMNGYQYPRITKFLRKNKFKLHRK